MVLLPDKITKRGKNIKEIFMIWNPFRGQDAYWRKAENCKKPLFHRNLSELIQKILRQLRDDKFLNGLLKN
jgi:hypothetical protein